jgi:hypothetical protein
MSDGQGFVRRLITYVAGDKNIQDLQYKASHVSKKKPKQMETFMIPIIFLSRLLFMLWGFIMHLVNIIPFICIPRRSMQRPFKTSKKQVGWSTTILLTDAKRVKNHFKVTLNDVLFRSLYHAVGRLLEENKQYLDGKITFMIPTSMRRFDDFSISNRTSLYMLGVPKENELERLLKKVSKRMKFLKSTMEANIFYFNSAWFFYYPNLIPKWYNRYSIYLISKLGCYFLLTIV